MWLTEQRTTILFHWVGVATAVPDVLVAAEVVACEVPNFVVAGVMLVDGVWSLDVVPVVGAGVRFVLLPSGDRCTHHAQHERTGKVWTG